MKKFFKIIVAFFVLYILSIFTVSAQSSADINVCDFSASNERNLYTQLNYSCEGIPWLPRTYEIYRKLDINECPTQDDTSKDAVDFVDTNGSSLFQGEYFVEDYMLFYQIADGSQRDSISWFENQYSTNQAALNLDSRQLPRPFLVTPELLELVAGSGAFTELSKYEGFVMCPVYGITPSDSTAPSEGNDAQISIGGSYDTSDIKYFKRADLVPPAVQEFENLFIDALYLIWGFVFIYGIIRLSYIGFQFIYGGTSPERLGELRASLSLWVIGLILVFLAVPFISFIYSLVGINTTKCYKLTQGGDTVYDLSLPGFTFFFNEVCTGDFAVENS